MLARTDRLHETQSGNPDGRIHEQPRRRARTRRRSARSASTRRIWPNELEGFVYLAAPQNFDGPPPENPFESLVALYIAAEDPVSRVLVKLAGEVQIDEQTGQIVSTFKNTPQVPFEDFKLDFFDGPRASVSLAAAVRQLRDGGIVHAVVGHAATCPRRRASRSPRAPAVPPARTRSRSRPGFQAGSTNLQAGAFTPFTVDIGRPDSDQAVQGVSMHLPPGIAGDALQR